MNQNNLPKVSIIIPSFNQGVFIERTILSILRQDYDGEIELIVSDGGSSDETVSILKKYPNIIWWSEKDSGYAEAVNKGLKVASGDVIGIQSSDDFYLQGAIRMSIQALINHPEWSLVAGNDVKLNIEDESISCKPIESGEINFRSLLFLKNIPQHTTFFWKEVIEKSGLVRTDFDMCADTDFWLRVLLFYKGGWIPQYTGVYSLHPNQRMQLSREWVNTINNMVESICNDSLYKNNFNLSKKEKNDYLISTKLYWNYQAGEKLFREAESVLNSFWNYSPGTLFIAATVLEVKVSKFKIFISSIISRQLTYRVRKSYVGINHDNCFVSKEVNIFWMNSATSKVMSGDV